MQVTIYLEDEVLDLVKTGAKDSGASQSKWIADAIRLRIGQEWPASIRALAGAWDDFPTAEEIRHSQGSDSVRESL